VVSANRDNASRNLSNPGRFRLNIGAGHRNRTYTTLRSPDFESGASASSASPARRNQNNNIGRRGIQRIRLAPKTSIFASFRYNTLHR
jgi:hypothetical protein